MAHVKYCRRCGQPFPKKNILEVGPNTLKFRLYNAVKHSRHGVRSDHLFDMLYGDDADGGPLSGYKMIHVLVWQVNRLLRPHKKVIRSADPNGGRDRRTTYFLSWLK